MAVIKLADHTPNQTYSYLFDTNVWLYIFGPVAGSNARKQRLYSELLNTIISRKGTIFITSLVIAEYVNRVLRLGQKQWNMMNGYRQSDFKHDYRPSEHYKETLEDAIAQVNEILKITTKRPDDFNTIDITSVLRSMSQSLDYNDSYLVKCCEVGGMKLVTDDKDMEAINPNITVIRA